jgi:hypothetical protein
MRRQGPAVHLDATRGRPRGGPGRSIGLPDRRNNIEDDGDTGEARVLDQATASLRQAAGRERLSSRQDVRRRDEGDVSHGTGCPKHETCWQTMCTHRCWGRLLLLTRRGPMSRRS